MSPWAKGIFVLIIFISSGLCPAPSTKVTENFNFNWESKAPGNLIAFRLSKESHYGIVCAQGHCFNATHNWSLLATRLNTEGNLGLLLIGQKTLWSLNSFHIDGTIFSKLESHMSHIRLPTSVVTQIAHGSELISSDHIKDQEIFKIKSARPWSSHWIIPLHSTVTSPFGSTRTVTQGHPYVHYGIDLRAQLKTPVRSCSDGVVVDASFDPIYGNVITVDHGQGLLSRYMHLSEFKIKVGDEVKGGEIIGLSGTTGRSEAPHLHWEMRYLGQPIDPFETSRLMGHLAYLE